MKKLFLLAIIALLSITAYAQHVPNVMYGKPKFAIPGGLEGKNYAIIVKSNKNRRAQIEAMTSLMRKYGIVDELKASEIDDRTSEYTLPFEIHQTVDACGGIMGATYCAQPLILKGELRFEFYENGSMMMVVQNFSPLLLMTTVKYDAVNMEKLSPALQEFIGENKAAASKRDPFFKFLVWANVGLDNMAEFYRKLNDYFADVDTKYKNYNALVSGGEAEWMTIERYYELLSKSDAPGSKYASKWVKKCMDEGRMPGVPEDRWQKSIRVVLDRLFVGSNEALGGEIVGVAEDGNESWVNVDGKVLPVDPKMRKKYENKGKTYVDFVND